MSAPIPYVTAFFAGSFGLLNLYYMTKVVVLRRSLRVAVGDGTHEVIAAIAKRESDLTEVKRKYWPLAKAIRAHGNFIENIPLGLVLFALLELQAFPKKYLLTLGSLFLVARLLHGSSLGITSKSGHGIGRTLGVTITVAVFLVASVANIYHAFPHLLH